MTRLEAVLDCVDLDANLRFFLDDVGGRIDLVRPADDPAEYVVVVADARVRLRRAGADVPAALRLTGDRAGELTAPNGTVVELVVDDTTIVLPESVPTLTATDPGSADDFGMGRAGMTYRDLLPDRWGGRFIASNIRVDHPGGADGDLADWVHFHRIRFQMIYVAAGWVEVVYEDQGPPFRMEVGDCVVQPPEIRHRVLRSSSGMEVIEVGCPAEHDTIADPGLDLPTAVFAPDRDFGGQRFVRHVAADAAWDAWPSTGAAPGWVCRDTGIGAATDGLAGAVVVRPVAGDDRFVHDDEFALLVATAGSGIVEVDGRRLSLPARASVAIPAGLVFGWSEASSDHEVLVVTLPATAIRRA